MENAQKFKAIIMAKGMIELANLLLNQNKIWKKLKKAKIML